MVYTESMRERDEWEDMIRHIPYGKLWISNEINIGIMTSSRQNISVKHIFHQLPMKINGKSLTIKVTKRDIECEERNAVTKAELSVFENNFNNYWERVEREVNKISDKLDLIHSTATKVGKL